MSPLQLTTEVYRFYTDIHIYLSLSSYEFCRCLTLVDHFTLSAAVLRV